MFTYSSRVASMRAPRRVLLLGGVVASLTFASLSSSAAQAALISTGACDNAALTQPFHAWGDTSSYKLVPGGNFEGSMSGWTLTGGAGQTAGSEPYGVTGSVGSKSMRLPAGSSAQSPFTCVNASYPTFRFVARNNSALATILVQVIYKDPILGLVPLPLGAVVFSGSWQPTLPMLTASAVGTALSGGVGSVALRFTAILGTSQIDDVYVDPRMN